MNIIFIPGLICTTEVWGDLNDLRNKYSCFDADLLNCSSLEETSQELASKFSQELKQSVVIGFSMGGYIAIDLAIRLGKKLKKLVLINTTADSVDQATVPERLKGVKWAQTGQYRQLLELNKGYGLYNAKPEWENLTIKMGLTIGPDVYVKQQQAIINRKSHFTELNKITAETLIITSKNDQVLPYQDSFVMAKKIEHSKLIMLDECGHFSIIEKSTTVKKHVIDFLES